MFTHRLISCINTNAGHFREPDSFAPHSPPHAANHRTLPLSPRSYADVYVPQVLELFLGRGTQGVIGMATEVAGELADTWGRDLALISPGISLTHHRTIIGPDPRVPGDPHSSAIRLAQ